jgi:hypothetical protein
MKTNLNFLFKVFLTSALLIFITGTFITGQDVIVKKNGDEIKAKVEQVLTTEIKYRKFENLTGPLYSIGKPEILMIKYENGSKDTFEDVNPVSLPVESSGTGIPAIIYFYRPSKVMGSPNEIIVGTNVPDEVIVKLKNGHWFKTEYAHTGQREFITGIFSINSETLKIEIEPGKTYYIQCSIMKGMGMQSQIELADEQMAKKEMNGLKEQKTAK